MKLFLIIFFTILFLTGMFCLWVIAKMSRIATDKEEPQEHKIPEKLSEYADINADIITKWSGNEEKLKDKINEIIDYLEENKKGGNNE